MDHENPKVRKITGTARNLFWKHGIHRITVEEICREAGVSKMTFYKYFPNKTELVRYIITRISDDVMQKYRDIMDSGLPFREKMSRMIQLKLESTRDISQEFINDIYKNGSPELLSFIQERVQEAFNMMTEYFSKAQKNKEIRQDINLGFIMFMFNEMVGMTTNEKLTRLYPNTQAMILEILKFFIYGVMPVPTQP